MEQNKDNEYTSIGIWEDPKLESFQHWRGVPDHPVKWGKEACASLINVIFIVIITSSKMKPDKDDQGGKTSKFKDSLAKLTKKEDKGKLKKVEDALAPNKKADLMKAIFQLQTEFGK